MTMAIVPSKGASLSSRGLMDHDKILVGGPERYPGACPPVSKNEQDRTAKHELRGPIAEERQEGVTNDLSARA